MRINVYSQELTDEIVCIEKVSNTGLTYSAVQLILHSSEFLHHPLQHRRLTPAWQSCRVYEE